VGGSEDVVTAVIDERRLLPCPLSPEKEYDACARALVDHLDDAVREALPART
jgi:hypothetical protein